MADLGDLARARRSRRRGTARPWRRTPRSQHAPRSVRERRGGVADVRRVAGGGRPRSSRRTARVRVRGRPVARGGPRGRGPRARERRVRRRRTSQRRCPTCAAVEPIPGLFREEQAALPTERKVALALDLERARGVGDPRGRRRSSQRRLRRRRVAGGHRLHRRRSPLEFGRTDCWAVARRWRSEDGETQTGWSLPARARAGRAGLGRRPPGGRRARGAGCWARSKPGVRARCRSSWTRSPGRRSWGAGRRAVGGVGAEGRGRCSPTWSARRWASEAGDAGGRRAAPRWTGRGAVRRRGRAHGSDRADRPRQADGGSSTTPTRPGAGERTRPATPAAAATGPRRAWGRRTSSCSRARLPCPTSFARAEGGVLIQDVTRGALGGQPDQRGVLGGRHRACGSWVGSSASRCGR